MILEFTLKLALKKLISNAIQSLIDTQQLMVEMPIIKIDRTRDKSHGDFSVNVAMLLAKKAKKNPRDIATLVINQMQKTSYVKKIEIAGPGFINFFVSDESRFDVVTQILDDPDSFGCSDIGNNQRIQVEFVSANPTGPLHVGHGRGAAYGATLANLLSTVGYNVDCEYYVNDAGRQMDILATSVWLRYLQEMQTDIKFPTNAYKGKYIYSIVSKIVTEYSDELVKPFDQVMSDLPKDEPDGGDKEIYIDALIVRAKDLLGSDLYQYLFNISLNTILSDIKNDLSEFGVCYDQWFSEKSLMESDKVNSCISKLQENNFIYEKGNALWFRSTDFGDDKDRVVKRDNGQTTYFASDIAYHLNKFERGYDQVIDVWGSDHHGYVPRVKAALTALGQNDQALSVLLVQFANLYRAGEKVAMSTRSGSFVTLRELREEVGSDAARFFYVMRKCEQHLDFDLELAKSKSSENPVYYIQYAHARISSVFRQLKDKEIKYKQQSGLDNLALLKDPHEKDLLQLMSKYPEVLLIAAKQHEPHLVANYLREIANAIHTYYNACHFIVDEMELRNARLLLILTAQQVIKNALKILGVSAPNEM